MRCRVNFTKKSFNLSSNRIFLSMLLSMFNRHNFLRWIFNSIKVYIVLRKRKSSYLDKIFLCYNITCIHAQKDASDSMNMRFQRRFTNISFFFQLYLVFHQWLWHIIDDGNSKKKETCVKKFFLLLKTKSIRWHGKHQYNNVQSEFHLSFGQIKTTEQKSDLCKRNRNGCAQFDA